MAGGKVGGGGLPPGAKQFRDSDGFADDKLGAEKAKKEQAQRAAKEAGNKSRAGELAKQVQQVQKAMMQDGRDTQSKAVQKETKQDTGLKPGAQSQKDGRPTMDGQLKAAGNQLSNLQSLLQQMDAALVDATEIIGASFADDKLAAEQATRKQSKERAKQDADKKSRQDKLNKQFAKVGESAQASKDAENKEKVRSLEAGDLGEDMGPELGKQGSKHTKVAKKSLADTIRTIEDQAAKLLKLGNLLGKQAAMEGKASQLREMAALIAAAHQKFKELLLPLLLGELGELRKNKYLQFKRLFDATENWPETIPPGRGCKSPTDWSEQDWDAFLSWFFIAPDLPEDLELPS
jgi:hypothetical protein